MEVKTKKGKKYNIRIGNKLSRVLSKIAANFGDVRKSLNGYRMIFY